MHDEDAVIRFGILRDNAIERLDFRFSGSASSTAAGGWILWRILCEGDAWRQRQRERN